MIRVVLVEDEYVVREGIKKIDWASHGYEFCGDASDGEMALPLIREKKPDIVITDIKMPFMDGLELSGLIKKEFPDMSIVILSGYEEFGFAKEAIQIGVAKYLTKPIGALELLKELDELKEGILKKKEERQSANEEDALDDAVKRRKDFLDQIVNGILSASEQLDGASDSSNAKYVDPTFDPGEISRINREEFMDFLKTGEVTDAAAFLDAFIDKIGEKALNSMIFRQYAVMDIYFTVTDFVTGLGGSKEDVEAPDKSMSVAGNTGMIKEYCDRIITSAIEYRDSLSHSKYKDVVDKVIGYIDEHYADEELSLNVLAEYVRFSPNHLSMIFSQQTGETFSKYLTDYRIGKAKEALKCTSKKSSEIALDVGYRDPHYFSYMFKKITGMTPTQYREGDKND